MKKVITTGKTVEEATLLALEKLGVDRERVTIRVITKPKKGLFGLIGSRDAEVEVEIVSNPIGDARSFLENVVSSMNMDIAVRETDQRDRTVTFELSGKQIGLLIGKRGQTLDSLQYLANLVANKQSDSYIRVVLDAEGFRDRRRESLERLAERLAHKSVATRRNVMLEPMPSHERKIIHSFLQNRTDVGTVSEGNEPYRKIVIIPKR